MLCEHGCKYMFFQSLSYYIENMASRSTKTCCRAHCYVLVWTPPHWDSIVIRTPPISTSKMSKTGKIKKNRYISVITQKSVIFKKSKIDFKSTGSVPVSFQPLATITHAYFQLYMLSTMRNQYLPAKIKNYR
jgi:hypothetical protein